jgi:predicted Zn-dependent protease
VLFKNGKVPEAAEAADKALSLGTEDALLDFHAGMIQLQLGRRARAQTLLKSALSLNLHFHPVYAVQAQVTLNQLAYSGTHRSNQSAPAPQAETLGGTVE